MTIFDKRRLDNLERLETENEKLRRDNIMWKNYLEKQVARALRVQKVIVEACDELEKGNADVTEVVRNLRSVGGSRGE